MVDETGTDYDAQKQPAQPNMFSRHRRQGPERWQHYQQHSARHISLMTRLGLLLTGFYSLFGWFFFGFGMLFVWVFGGNGYLHEMAFFSGELQTIQARITHVRQTRLEINDNRVYEYHYSFNSAGRQQRGSSDGYGGRYREGDKVALDYAPGDPGHSRIAGMDLGLGGWPFFFALLFPLVGAGFIYAGLRQGVKGIRLLGEGSLTEGRFLSREATSTRINNRTVYSYLFEFEASDGRVYQARGRSHLPEKFAGESEPVHGHGGEGEEEIIEQLLYNPENPADAVLLDDLPGSPRISGDGLVHLTGARPIGLLLPAAVVICNLLWMLHVLEFL